MQSLAELGARRARLRLAQYEKNSLYLLCMLARAGNQGGVRGA